MKNFFSTFFASCLGVFAAILVGFFIMAGMAMSSMSESNSYSDNSVLKLTLEDEIPERSENVEKQSLLLGSQPDAIGLSKITKLIEAAAIDPKIKGIILQNNSVSIGQASILTLMTSLQNFKESGKFIYSYADMHSQSSYLLCSVADSMFLHPLGGVDLKGYGIATPFFKNMLDKIGVEMNVFYAGNFKSATEPFRFNEMSENNKLQVREFLSDMKDIAIENISKNRSLSPGKIDSIMFVYGGRNAKLAKTNGLVDDLFYKDQFDDMIRKKLGLEDGKKIKTITLSKYNTLADLESSSTVAEKIAVIHAEGEIIYGSDEAGIVSEKKYLKLLEKIRNDKKIKAVVLRVNSPGGNAFTSDVIWREIEKIKESGKPVIASFGDYAASGGYYIAAGANKIVAQPNTLTGSIGVFMMFPNATKLLNDKLGVNFDTIKTHPFATGFSMTNNLTEKEKALLQESTLDIYDIFIDRVSTGRKLSKDSTKLIAQGRVWTGRRAKEIGLVDELGDLNDAIKIAATEAKISSYKVVEYPTVEEDIFATIMKKYPEAPQHPEEASTLFTSASERKIYDQFLQMKSILRCKEPQARLPYIVNFD